MFLFKKIAFLSSAILVVGAQLGINAVHAAAIPHNEVKAFESDAPSWQYAWQPYLELSNACHPYPAVQKNGDWNAGLKNSGPVDGSCGGSDGQVYSRYIKYPNKKCGIMFSWYFPKDGADPLIKEIGKAGHTHDWENIILWLKSCSKNGEARDQVIAISYSQHDKADIRLGYDNNNWHAKTKHMKVLYVNGKDPYLGARVMNHQLETTKNKGGMQPLIAWNSLSAAAKKTLNTADFGKANVPFNEKNFIKTMNKGMPAGFLD
jgi:Necrosis inducing protein (NPP1)